MRAIQLQQHGGPEVLRLADVPVSEPGPGEARIKVAAAGLNFIEIYQRLGQYKMTLPATLGEEGAGVVDAVGPGVTDVRVGDRVASVNLRGSYAQYALAAVDRLVPVPQAVSLEVAAAVMLQGMTAQYLTSSTYPLRAGETALVHAGAGGVGGLLVQIAKKQHGATVITTVGTDEKARQARELGADAVILYRQQDFAAETRRLTDGKGVSVVYDSVGKDTFDQSLDCLSRRGYMVLYGQSSGPVPPINPQILNAKGSLFLTRPTLRDYVFTHEELLQRAGDLFRWIAAGDLRVRVDRSFPLTDAGQAQQYLADRKSHGKVLLVPEQG